MFGKEQERQYALIVAKTWIDPQFRERFIAQPREVLEQYGIDIPKGFDVRVNPNSSQATATIELGIPPKPQVADEHIERMLILDAAKCLCADFCACKAPPPPPPPCYKPPPPCFESQSASSGCTPPCWESALSGGCTCKTCTYCYEAESGKCTCRTCRTCSETESGKCICRTCRTCYEAESGKCIGTCRPCFEPEDSGKCVCRTCRTCYEADAAKCAPPCRLCWQDEGDVEGCV
jgi:hypothetical protein